MQLQDSLAASRFCALVRYAEQRLQEVGDDTSRDDLYYIAFCTDFLSYRLHGRPITGVTYRKLGQTPVPDGDPLAHCEDVPDVDLTTNERAMVDRVIDGLCGGAEMSRIRDISLGLTAARPGEVIPYGVARFSAPQTPTASQEQHAQRLERNLR